ncbi:hypothetical protein NR798_05970 [Archangium gephyra]|uniref:Kelch repeat-containing protein n=1 Tax=Archangium gephyra TaxID=48 RepID=UPI0035D4E228
MLASNKVLVVGGWSYSSLMAGALTYEPASATWSPAGTLALAREAHTATRLSSGKVLVVGGETFQPPSGYTHTAELYDPATNSWSAAGGMSHARGYNTATLLVANPALSLPERVLVVGGLGGGALRTVDLYNTATGTWSTAAPLIEPRYSHTAVRLASGKVLVAGGWAGGSLATTELYEPTTNTWTSGRPMTTARYGHTATELPSGKILVVGGQKDSAPGTLDFTATAELYDPSTNTWASAGTLSGARGFHTATLVSGKVLVAGGRGPGAVTLATAELYDASTNTWSSTNSLLGARSDHAAVYSTPLGKVLVVGGSNSSALATAELYDADSCGSITCNTPPGPCYNSTGTCSAGTCSYAPKTSGAACNDGNACTTSDVCNGSGVCGGSAMICNSPPGPCYSSAGTCSAGSCSYAPTAAGTTCDDADACTSGDVCNGAGTCSGSAVACTLAWSMGGMVTTVTVPAGRSVATFSLWGAGGGGGNPGLGGGGAWSSARLPVTSGDQLEIRVGGRGQAGGGGGGASYVFRNGALMLVAAGGGGAGTDGCSGCSTRWSVLDGAGGGGGAVGGVGQPGNPNSAYEYASGGGQGGQPSGGGGGGGAGSTSPYSTCSVPGLNGSLGRGGAVRGGPACSDTLVAAIEHSGGQGYGDYGNGSSGGGGAGLYGGGSGGQKWTFTGGGGGGGSSWVHPSATLLGSEGGSEQSPGGASSSDYYGSAGRGGARLAAGSDGLVTLSF